MTPAVIALAALALYAVAVRLICRAIAHAGENAEPDDGGYDDELMAIADAVQDEPTHDWDALMIAELMGGNA